MYLSFYLVIASTATYPIIVARTIMQDSRSTGDSQHVSIKDVFKDVYQKRGIKGFYAGLRPDLLRILPSNTIVFVVYELIKRRINIADTLSDWYFYFYCLLKIIVLKKSLYSFLLFLKLIHNFDKGRTSKVFI
jgi:hypothetical protein